MNITTPVILTPKPKKGGRQVSDAEILRAVRTVNARYADARSKAGTIASATSTKRHRSKINTPAKAK